MPPSEMNPDVRLPFQHVSSLLVSWCGALALVAGAHAQPAPAQPEGAASVASVPVWSVHEVALTADSAYANPYTDVAVTATFTSPGGDTLTVPGFWDGERTWRLRFTPTSEGAWRYETASDDAGLGGQTGTVEATAPEPDAHGFVRVDPEHPYHFVYDSGARYFMLGTTYYEILANAEAEGGWKRALRGSAGYGINKVRFNVGEGSSDDRGAGFPDASPYAGGDHDRLDLDHFRRLDEVVHEMAELGLVADMILFWNSETNYGTVDQDERFVRYILARYAAYPHVIWCLTNEWNYTGKPRAYWNGLGRLVRAEDPYLANGDRLRPLSIHHQTRIDFQFFDQEWPTTAIVQLGVRNGQRIVEDEWSDVGANQAQYTHGDDWGWHSIVYNRGHDMPVVNDEYGYMGEPKDRSAGTDSGDVALTRAKHRRILWGIYLAGGYASAGDKYQYEDPLGRPYFAATWHEAEEYQDLQHLKTFFTARGLRYWEMEPLPDVVAEGERAYVLGTPGEQYAVYAAAGGTVTLDLAPGRYAQYRYNPSTGEEQPWADVEGGRRTFLLPSGEDVALRLVRQDGASPQASYLYLEAEEGEVQPPFAVAADSAASDGRYIWVPEGESFATVTVPQAGTYKLLGRVRSPSGADNSVWVQVDDGAWGRWEMAQGADWHGDEVYEGGTRRPLRFELDAGERRLGLRQREDGTRVDALVLTDDLDYTWDASEKPGHVYLRVEAEAFDMQPPLAVAEAAEASGGRYVWMPGGAARYAFTVDRAGTYYVWGRVLAPYGGNDSFKVQVDDGPSRSWNGMQHQDGWHWEVMHDSEGEVFRFELGPGEHALSLRYREDGSAIDRLLITDDPAFHP